MSLTDRKFSRRKQWIMSSELRWDEAAWCLASSSSPGVHLSCPLSVLKACGEWQRPVMTIMCCSGAKKNILFVRQAMIHGHEFTFFCGDFYFLWVQSDSNLISCGIYLTCFWHYHFSNSALQCSLRPFFLSCLLKYYSRDVWSCETFIFWTKSLEYFGIVIIPRLKNDFSSLRTPLSPGARSRSQS